MLVKHRQMLQELFCLLSLAVILGSSILLVYNGLGQSSYFLPTYDNAMLMAARSRVILDTGKWAEYNLVFGGITKSYQQPFAPSVVAGLSELTGLNLWWAVRLYSIIVTGILFPLSFFVIAREISGRWSAGIASAAIALSLSNLMVWATRTSPVGIGVVMVVAGLYFISRKKYALAAVTGVSLALSHPPSCLVFGLTIGIYFVLSTLYEIFRTKGKGAWVTELLTQQTGLIMTGALTFLAFISWHVRQTGLDCLEFKCLPQVGAHEYGGAVNLISYLTAEPASVFAIGGIAWTIFSKRLTMQNKLLLASWLLAMVLLIKNDALGVNVFTQRFLTYFDEVLAVLGGLFIAWLYGAISDSFEAGHIAL